MIDRQIHYWAHMLDESKHASYYEVYMQQHPEDELPTLIDSLVKEFAQALKKDHIKLEKSLKNGQVNVVYLEKLIDKLKTTYYWHRIKAQVYAAIISRFVALSDRAKGQKFNEDELSYDDVSHTISRKTVEECLDIICHNVNVLEANNCIVNNFSIGKSMSPQRILINKMSSYVNDAFKKYGIPALPRYDSWHDKMTEDYLAAIQVYKKWGSYAKGNAGEKYVCDSDNGPEPVRKVLNDVEYLADDIDLIVTLNKALDVVHFRSDLAAAFIEGGQQTCALVSNLPDKFVI